MDAPTTTGAAVEAALATAASWPAPAVAVGACWLEEPTSRWPARPGPRTVARAHWGDADRPGPFASVTKLLTALATLVAVEEGTVALDQPAGPPGATVAHLLAHASGLGPTGDVLARPGRRRIYSNAGFDLLAATVADAAGMVFADYLAEAVLTPLGMRGTVFGADASPASGAVGPLTDLLVLGTELLAPRLLDPTTVVRATAVAFPGLPGVVPGIGSFDPCDWGLGFELRDDKRPHWTGTRCSPATFGHFGRSGAFLWVDPDAGVAGAGVSGRPFGPWALASWPGLADAVLGARHAASTPVVTDAGVPCRGLAGPAGVGSPP